MKIRLVLLAIAAVAMATTVSVASAAPTPSSDAHFLSALKRSHHGKKATVKVRYNCAKGDTLWISAKQTKSGKRSKALKAEGSSSVARTWLDSHRNPIVCDGTDQTSRFKVDKVERGTKGHLVKGQAWVQFCITFNQKLLTLSKSGWVAVR
jgi:hypothetical protein